MQSEAGIHFSSVGEQDVVALNFENKLKIGTTVTDICVCCVIAS